MQQPQSAVSPSEQSHNAAIGPKNSSSENKLPKLNSTLKSTTTEEVTNRSKTATDLSVAPQSSTVDETLTSNVFNSAPSTALSYFPPLNMRPVGRESNRSNPSQPLPLDMPYGVKPTRPTIAQHQSADHLKYLRVLSALKSPALSAKRFFCSKCPSVMLDGLEKYEHFQVCMIK